MVNVIKERYKTSAVRILNAQPNRQFPCVFRKALWAKKVAKYPEYPGSSLTTWNSPAQLTERPSLRLKFSVLRRT